MGQSCRRKTSAVTDGFGGTVRMLAQQKLAQVAVERDQEAPEHNRREQVSRAYPARS